jgi:predicted metal-dependent hydrolase
MAQGGLKKSGGKFVPTKPKSSRKSKPLGPKKSRGQRIAPKKPKSVQAAKLKKQLQKSINQCIEEEITHRAKQGGTEFRVLSNSSSSSSSASSSSSSAPKKDSQTNSKEQ